MKTKLIEHVPSLLTSIKFEHIEMQEIWQRALNNRYQGNNAGL